MPVETRSHETKYVLSNSSVPTILRWLRSRCSPDPKFPASIVSSIYYDTPSLRFLREKFNSDFIKTKVRLRWYADTETGKPEAKSFLEAKYKIGNTREKIRRETHITGDWLSNVNLNNRALKNIPRMFISEKMLFPDIICPVFKISYTRMRFIEPTTGSRLCVDYDISSSGVNWKILPDVPPFRLQTAVFELKGKSKELPRTLHQLTALGCRKFSFSKYMICYKKIIREI
ncbi:VTC domain-containing protein [Acidobacteriota bacterium]